MGGFLVGLAGSAARVIEARGVRMLAAVALIVSLLVAGSTVSDAGSNASGARSPWGKSLVVDNTVVSRPVTGGGYPVPPGQRGPVAGTCRAGQYNANHGEAWLAVKPGTEDLVGTAKFFFEKFSTFGDFNVGSYSISDGVPIATNQVQGFDCVSTGTQQSPPTWTNNTDPNADFDTKGRVYQVTPPFNAYWVDLHPSGAIELSYSDDLGRHWVIGNGGQPLELLSKQKSKSAGKIPDKPWIAVNHIAGSHYQDHVYATWTVYDGQSAHIRLAVSRDRGQTFSKPLTLSAPGQTGSLAEFPYVAVDAGGDVYLAVASDLPTASDRKTIYVTRSSDDGVTWSSFVPVVQASPVSGCCLPNTTFADGILESFAASPDYPGHLYLVWEAWDGTQFDVKFSQSVDFGQHWSAPIRVNDNAHPTASDQFQPQVAAGPRGAVAVNFYDRRGACPADPSVLPDDVGRENFCIDVSLQVFKDQGAGALPVGGNVRVSQFAWDPEQPGQTIDGIDQRPCGLHNNPCTSRVIIGDYFGLAISDQSVYTLAVSTHYPSDVIGDGGDAIYYQQNVLETVPRSALGI